MIQCICKEYPVFWICYVIIHIEEVPMVPEIPKNDIFIIKNFIVVVTLMAYGRVRLLD